jgi:hypothetical protein
MAAAGGGKDMKTGQIVFPDRRYCGDKIRDEKVRCGAISLSNSPRKYSPIAMPIRSKSAFEISRSRQISKSETWPPS